MIAALSKPPAVHLSLDGRLSDAAAPAVPYRNVCTSEESKRVP